MKILIDTCVLAEVRHPQGNPAVRAAVEAIDDHDLFLSVITLGEIAKGVELLPVSDKKNELRQWLNGLYRHYSGRILPIDLETANIWGEVTAHAQVQDVQIPVSDGLIAATSLRHGLHVMTRNTRHFAISGALTIDPWDGS